MVEVLILLAMNAPSCCMSVHVVVFLLYIYFEIFLCGFICSLLCVCYGRFGDSLSLRNSVLRSPTAEYSWVKSLSCHGGERTLAECLTITSSESSRSDYCEVVPATVICGKFRMPLI